jgi:hypothetical protein
MVSPAVSGLAALASTPTHDRQHVPAQDSAYQRIVVVSPVGSPAANGAALRAALDGVAATCDERCLLIVGPGAYELGTEPLRMKPFVDIAGAGEESTRLTARVSVPGSGAVIGADHAELRGLAVLNSSGGPFTAAIFNDGVAPRLTHVTANAAGTHSTYGIYNCNGAAPALHHVTATATGAAFNAGVYNDGAMPVMNHVTAAATGGRISCGVYNLSGAAPTLKFVLASALDGESNFGVFDAEGTAPTMIHVVATASGGVENVDLYAD